MTMDYNQFNFPDAVLAPPEEPTPPNRCPACKSTTYRRLYEQKRRGYFETFIVGCTDCIKEYREDAE